MRPRRKADITVVKSKRTRTDNNKEAPAVKELRDGMDWSLFSLEAEMNQRLFSIEAKLDAALKQKREVAGGDVSETSLAKALQNELST